MELVLQTRGDDPTGIEPVEIVLKTTLFLTEPEDHEEREFLRKEMIAILEIVADDKVKFAIYEDECYGCRKLKKECICPKEV